MKNITLGIVAHVDSGKTTLSEAILYKMGFIKEYGRVDNGDCFLDTDYMERKRGITIFSKQANFTIKDSYFSLIDTPGHVDFSAEMERSLQVLDYAILVINGSEGVKGHTLTLWRLLKAYNIPTFIFVNKMDMHDCNKHNILHELRQRLCSGIFDFSQSSNLSDNYEDIALSAGEYENFKYVFDDFLEQDTISLKNISVLIKNRIIFPCYFGSALKLLGIEELLQGIYNYSFVQYPTESFGGKVFKITRDYQGNRLVHLKITSGELKVKDQINGDEKVNQIRIYSGDKFITVDKVEAGKICTVLGLATARFGQGLGVEKDTNMTLIEPVLSYELICPPEISKRKVFPELKSLEEEFTELALEWIEGNESIKVKVMGEVQIEILQNLIKDRYGFVPEFGVGKITYKETITNSVIGVGHFEPLRHYAEVHLLIEPAEPGLGIVVESDCSEDVLNRHWQRLIMTHIKEKTHKGVLTGSELTDVIVTVINGKAHNKHTEGGDFRQATYRAIRQGLMEAESILLEPFYEFVLCIPATMVGKAMTDIEAMYGRMEPPDIRGDEAIIRGKAPVSTIRDYQIHLNAYTKGCGNITLTFCGYEKCHNPSEVMENISYNPDEDIENPSSSVFCSHGAGVIIPWYEVKDNMHVFDDSKSSEYVYDYSDMKKNKEFDYSIGNDEIDSILAKTYYSNQKESKQNFNKKKPPEYHFKASNPKIYKAPKDKLLIVDGYNVIFAWEELKSLAETNILSAKDKLTSILSNYKGMVEHEIVIVFDGYKAKENKGEEVFIEDIKVIHTKEGQTADNYIEQFAHNNTDKYNITVASSDGMIQQITRGLNCTIMSSRELDIHIKNTLQEFRENFNIK